MQLVNYKDLGTATGPVVTCVLYHKAVVIRDTPFVPERYFRFSEQEMKEIVGVINRALVRKDSEFLPPVPLCKKS